MPPDRIVIGLTRREICAAAIGCAAAGLLGCVAGDQGAVATGPLPDDPGASGDDVDASSATPADAAVGRHADAAGVVGPADAMPAGASCAPSYHDVGAPSSFATGTATFFSNYKLFVVRDSGGLYALSSACTHQGYPLRVQSNQFYCNRHGATFDLNGAVRGGPVSAPLQHFAMCMMSSGNVGVDPTQRTSAGARLSV